MTTELTWTGSPDDQTARIGDYVLRVELMYKGAWWWGVYFEEFQVDMAYKVLPPTIDQAKTACEKAYYEHLKTRG